MSLTFIIFFIISVQIITHIKILSNSSKRLERIKFISTLSEPYSEIIDYEKRLEFLKYRMELSLDKDTDINEVKKHIFNTWGSEMPKFSQEYIRENRSKKINKLINDSNYDSTFKRIFKKISK